MLNFREVVFRLNIRQSKYIVILRYYGTMRKCNFDVSLHAVGQPISWSRILLKTLIVAQLVK
jgi:hypothetical protein